jgi:sporulation protein YlmC with PRC-barrel domain
MSVQRAPENADDAATSKLKGKRIRGSDGAEIGKIHDFVLDAATGKVAHIVVSSGGVLGVGDKLRLVPPTDVQQAGDKEFTASMGQAEFKALATITKEDLEAGRISAHPGTQREPSSSPGDPSSQGAGQMVLASELADKDIKSDDNEIGEIEHVLIDFQNGTATALVDVESDFAGDRGKYIVPFSKLEIGSAESDTIASSLMRSDFASGQASASAGASANSASGTVADSRATQSVGANQPTGASSTTEGQSGRSESSADLASSEVTSSSSPSNTPSEFSSSTAGRSSSADSSSGLAASTGSPSSSSSAPSTDTSSSGSSSSLAAAGSTGSSTSTDNSDSASVSQGPSAQSSQLASDTSSTSATGSTATADQGSSASRAPASGDTANAGASIASTSQNTDEQLSPTGQTSAQQNPGSAMAVRQALDGDPKFARENVQVTTKIVLQGTVESEEAKKRVEELAREAAGSAQVDNQITVQPK